MFAVTIFGASGCNSTPEEVANVENRTAENLQQTVETDEMAKGVTIIALQLFEKGETQTYRKPLSEIPNAPPVPNSFRSIDKGYYLQTSSVFTGAVIRFTTSVEDEEQFKKFKVLTLVKDELYPSRYAWRECTIEKKESVTQSRKGLSHEEINRNIDVDNAQVGDYFPDFAHKVLSCEFTGKNGTRDYYFALVMKEFDPPADAFTEIEAKLESVEKGKEGEGSDYTFSISNNGPKDAAEINLMVAFHVSSILDAFPSQGQCHSSPVETVHGTMFCYLGSLRTGGKASVKFATGRYEFPKEKFPDMSYENWRLHGFARQDANDPAWPVNYFLLKQPPQKKR